MKHAESTISEGVEFSYRHAAGKDFGRMTSDSMMGIARDIRGFACIDEDTKKPILTDLDMDNCHPVILEWLCQKNGIACETVTEYVANRQLHKEDLMESTGRSKEDVKTMFLTAMNSQSAIEYGRANQTKFFVDFEKQCKAIQLAVLQLREYRHLLTHAETNANEKLEEKRAERRRDRKTISGITANVAGSFLNLVLCTWENRFIGLACKTISEINMKVSVNNYDGMMIVGDHSPEPSPREKPGTAVRDDRICPILERALFDQFGITMGWSMKRHSTSLEFSADGIRFPYAKHSEHWLKQICRVGCEYVVKLTDGSTVTETGRNIADRLKAETAKCILDCPDAKDWWIRKSFAETLMNDPAMETYEKAAMYPDVSECPPEHYNLWTPMPCEAWDVTQANSESDNVAVFLELVLVLSDRHARVAAFIGLWIAHMLKYPGRKPNAWLILMSEEGAGKGTLVEIIKRLVGEGKVKEVNNVQRSLLGTFNQVMLDAFLVVIDEASGKHLFDGKEELKNMISGTKVPVNQKNVKEKEVRSYARFMVTLQPRSVPTKKGDRRGVIARCSDELIGNRAFWEDINRRMDGSTFVPDVHAYLMTLEPPPVFQPDELPQTDVQRELQAANADIFEAWIFDVVDRWLSPGEDTTEHDYQLGEAGLEYELRDSKGRNNKSQMNVFPEFIMQDLFRDFGIFAQRTNAVKLTECIRFQVFVSKFAICRWRKSFEWKPTGGKGFQKRRIKGVSLQCRSWDMLAIARDMEIESNEVGGDKTESDVFSSNVT